MRRTIENINARAQNWRVGDLSSKARANHRFSRGAQFDTTFRDYELNLRRRAVPQIVVRVYRAAKRRVKA
jgi:hypothetical protein